MSEVTLDFANLGLGVMLALFGVAAVLASLRRCHHRWTVLDEGKITSGGKRTGTFYSLQCERCGDLKITNLES